MIITGANGHAQEILDILTDEQKANCYLYDDVTNDIPAFVNNIPICTNMAHAKQLLKKNPVFVLGTGSGVLRKKFKDMFTSAGGEVATVASSLAFCSTQQTIIGNGVNIMAFAFISAGVTIGEGCLINARAHLHHNVLLGEYCEISPAAVLLGHVQLGNFVSIGAGAVILPGLVIGDNAVIGAGSVVTKNVSAGITVVGNPANEKKL